MELARGQPAHVDSIVPLVVHNKVNFMVIVVTLFWTKVSRRKMTSPGLSIDPFINNNTDMFGKT